jgi:small subunit ribosomal protein S1
MNILLEIIGIIEKYRLWGLILLLVLIIYILLRTLLDEDKSNIWRGIFYKVLYKLFKKGEAEKRYISNDVSGRLNLARRQMPFGKDLIPKSIKLEWIENAQGESYVPKEGELVVKLDPAEAQENNITSLAQALVQRTALIGIRYVLEKAIEDAIDLNLIKSLLSKIGNRPIMDWYMRHEYMPQVVQSDDLKKWNSKIVEIDERGLFTRLLLVELESYGKNLSGRPKTIEMESEIKGLIEFIFKIATKRYGEDAPLDYRRRNIKIGVLLVGETSKVLWSIEPYIKAFAMKLNQEAEAIYVVSFSKEFLKEKDEESEKAFEEIRACLHKRIEKDFNVQKDFELAYSCYDIEGRRRKAKCIRYVPIFK